jgi:hypothetical protein
MKDKKTTYPEDSDRAQKARSFSATLKPSRGRGKLCLIEALLDLGSRDLRIVNHTTGETLVINYDEFQAALKVEAQDRK